MANFPLHSYGIPQAMGPIIQAMQQKNQMQADMQGKELQLAISQRKEKQEQSRWNDAAGFKLLTNMQDFISKDLPVETLAPTLKIYKEYAKKIGINLDITPYMDAAERKQALSKGIETNLSNLFTQIESNPSDPKLVTEFISNNAKYEKASGKKHPIYSMYAQELVKNITKQMSDKQSPSGGYTGDIGQIQQIMKLKNVDEQTAIGMLRQINAAKRQPKQLGPRDIAFQNLSPEDQRTSLLGKQPQPSFQQQAYDAWKLKPGNASKTQDDYLRESKDNGKENYSDRIYQVAQDIGIPPLKVKAGKLSRKEANDLLTRYKELFGAESILGLIMSGQFSGLSGNKPGEQPTIKFDAKGNPIK